MSKYDENRRVICPQCGGDKQIRIMVPVMHPRKFDLEYAECPLCKGEGIAVKIIEYKSINEKS